MRLIFCLLLYFASIKISIASNSSIATPKDLIVLDLLTCLNFLDVCKSLETQSESMKIKDRLLHSTSPDIVNDLGEIKFRPLYLGYQKEFVEKIKDLLTSYRKTKCGLNQPNGWQIYNQCLTIEANKTPRKPTGPIRFELPDEKSLMNLAQKMVAADAAKSHDDALKLLTLFRDSNGAQLQKLLQESFTLHIPMTRAFRKTKTDPKTSFIKNLVYELKKGYWRDEDFVSTIRYIHQYMLYEFSLAKTDHRWSKSYRLLKNGELKDLAQQLLANFICLYIVSPFLMDRIPLHEIKKFAEVEALAFNYDSKQKPLSFSEISPIWHELISLIIGKHKSKLRTNSLKTRSSRSRLTSSRSLQESMWSSSSIPDISALEIIDYLMDCEENFDHPTKALPGLATLKNLLEIIAQLPENSMLKKISEEVYLLQQTIRSANYYHGCAQDDLCIEAVSAILVKMEKAPTWHELLILFEVLINLAQKYPGDIELSYVVTELAHGFTDDMHCLDEEALTKFLRLLSRLGKRDLFNRLYQFAETLKNVSKDPKNLTKTLSVFSLPINLEPYPSAFDHSSWTSRKNSLTLKYREKRVKILLPKKGIKELCQVLRQNHAFKDAPFDVLAMIARILRPRYLQMNEILYEEESPIEAFSLITDGEVESTSLNQLSDGQLKFSNQQFIPKGINVFDKNRRHPSTIKAIKPSYICELPLRELKKLLEENPLAMKKIFQTIAAMVYRQEQRFAELKISQPRDENLFMKLLEEQVLVGISTLGSLKSHEILVNQNDKAYNLYWVENGNLWTGHNYQTEIPAHRYLDEIAFFAKKYHPYEVKAGSLGCCLVVFSAQQFYKIAVSKPDLLCQMAEHLLEIVNKNDALLRQTDLYKLQRAIKAGDLDMVMKIASLPNIDIDLPSPIENMPAGTRPIHIAARHNQHQILDYLVKQGADIDGKDNLGNTAAHIAAHYNHLQIFRTLKLNGANFWLENNYQETPFEVADLTDNKQILDFLRSN